MTDPLQPWRALVLKDRVSLGGLDRDTLRLALALVHATLPPDQPMSEREVNEALRAALAGAAGFLATDHVELRRRLVDAGWLARDGYGREYRALAQAALPAAEQALARTLATVDAARWVAAERAEAERARAERKARWQEAQGRVAGPSPGGRPQPALRCAAAPSPCAASAAGEPLSSAP